MDIHWVEHKFSKPAEYHLYKIINNDKSNIDKTAF